MDTREKIEKKLGPKARVVKTTMDINDVGSYQYIGNWWKREKKKSGSKNLCLIFRRLGENYLVIDRREYLELSETYGRMVSPPYFGMIWMSHKKFELTAVKVEDFLQWTEGKIKRRRVLKRKPAKKLVRKRKPGFDFGATTKKKIKRIKRLKR